MTFFLLDENQKEVKLNQKSEPHMNISFSIVLNQYNFPNSSYFPKVWFFKNKKRSPEIIE